MSIQQHEALKARQRAERETFPDTLGLRVHRAISWLGRAEKEVANGDLDAAFIFYWVTFNAAYAGELIDSQSDTSNAREDFRRYFGLLLKADSKRAIYDAVWTRFAGPIRVLLDNPYVFSPFWQAQRDGSGASWKTAFERSQATAHSALTRQDTQTILQIIFDRLYVLRNQIMHGGATWNSAVNRDQLRDGVEILAWLIPTFISLKMDQPELDWGQPFYPVVEA
ncbi:MAG: HEPN domain-containing protein [Maricaulis sp.]|nr:HEPN domain-containing protein [Maricaulis sp.]